MRCNEGGTDVEDKMTPKGGKEVGIQEASTESGTSSGIRPRLASGFITIDVTVSISVCSRLLQRKLP